MLTMLGACGMWHGYGAHVAVAMALIALALGYFVSAKAQCSESPTCCKKMGKVVGWFIMIVAALLLICLGYKCYLGCSGKQCPLHSEGHLHDTDTEVPGGEKSK